MSWSSTVLFDERCATCHYPDNDCSHRHTEPVGVFRKSGILKNQRFFKHPKCRDGVHYHPFCVCKFMMEVSNPGKEDLRDFFMEPGELEKERPLDEVLKHLFFRMRRMEKTLAGEIRSTLHYADQGDMPTVRRTLRNVLEQLGASPDGVEP